MLKSNNLIFLIYFICVVCSCNGKKEQKALYVFKEQELISYGSKDDISTLIIRDIDSIPASISEFTNVEDIFIAFPGKKKSYLPISLGKLSKLANLSVFEASDITNLSQAITVMPGLKRLTLSRLDSVPGNLFLMKDLKYLHLSKIKMGDAGMKICAMKSLETISITGTFVKAFPDCICEMEHLKVIDTLGNSEIRLPDCWKNK
jgi:hypothetical protein